MFPRLGDNLAPTIQIAQLPFLSSIHCEALAWLWWYFDLGHKALERMHQLTSGPVCSRLALTMSTWLKCCQWKNKVFSKLTLLACLLMLSCCFRIILTLDTSRLQSWWEFLQKLDSGRSQPLLLQKPDHKRSDCSSCSTQIHKPEIRFDINTNHTGGYGTAFSPLLVWIRWADTEQHLLHHVFQDICYVVLLCLDTRKNLAPFMICWITLFNYPTKVTPPPSCSACWKSPMCHH